MMQGDSYGLPIEILRDGKAVTPEDVTNVEISVGSITKTYAKNKVYYSNGMWIIPLSQEETFNLPAASVRVQARVMWATGGVTGVDLGDIDVIDSISKEVL